MELVKLITPLAFILDNLVWPLIFIIYPLYASIRAIENNSLADNRKCLTYWVTCGLIMLFEILLAGLLEWLPFWSYFKLVVTLLLVARHFEGAVYAYDHFIRPCFGINQHTFCYWLRMKPGELSVINSDKFVLLASKFVQENGAEALEKLIDKVNSVEQKLPIAENKSVTSVKNKEGNPLKIILESSLVDTGHEATATTENRASAKANVAQLSEHHQSSVPNTAQQEWTCALCQVCTPNEVLLHNHLQGKKHKANEEKIKVSTHAQTNNKADEESKNQSTGEVRVTGGGCELPGLSSLEYTIKDSSHSLCQVYSLGDASLLDSLQGKEHKAKDTELSRKHVAAGNTTVPNFENMDKTKVTPKEGMSMRTENKPVVGAKDGGCESPASSAQDKTQKSWKCTVCQIFAPNEIALQGHFQGRKHKAKRILIKSLAKATAANNKTTPSSDSKFAVKPKVTQQKKSVSASLSSPKHVKNSEEKKPGEPSVINSDKFVLLATKFVQENGAEALEKVIDKVNSVEQKLPIAENKSVTSVKNKEGNPLKIVLESSLVDTGHEATATTENRASEKANVAQVSEHHQSSVPNTAQKEWTCALCQVCTPNEVLLHNHLQGKKHKANEEKIKVSTHAQTNNKADEASKNQSTGEARLAGGGCELSGLSSLDDTEKDSSHSLYQVYSLGDASLLDPLLGKEHKAKDTELSIKHDAARTKTASNSESMDKTKVTSKEGMSLRAQTNKKKVSNIENKPVVGVGGNGGGCESPASSALDKTQKSWTCAVCHIFALSEIALQEHFQGRNHKAKQMEHLAKATAANNKTTPSSDSKFAVKPKVTQQKKSVSASLCSPEHVKNSEEKKIGGFQELGTGDQRIPLSDLWCDKCKLQCNSLYMLTEHRRGKRHKVQEI